MEGVEMTGYDAERFNLLLKEQLDAAARAGVDSEDIETILQQHRDGIHCHGLKQHAGLTTIPFEDELNEQ